MSRTESARLTLTVPYAIDKRLREMAEREGRSISNLAAHLIKEALADWERDGKPQ